MMDSRLDFDSAVRWRERRGRHKDDHRFEIYCTVSATETGSGAKADNLVNNRTSCEDRPG